MNDGVIHFIDYPTTTQHINNSFIHEDDHGTIWILPPLGELSFTIPKLNVSNKLTHTTKEIKFTTKL